jgi:dynein light intermediate chain 1
MPNSLPPLIQSTLGIHSLLKRQPLKHNVIDRDKIFIPPNWDSWGKIRVLREGFDVEGVSDGWSTAIQPSPKPKDADEMDHVSQTEDESGGPVAIYEQMIHNPEGGNEISPNLAENGLEIKSEAMQEFLARQLESMEKLKAEEEKSSELGQERPERSYARLDSDGVEEHGRVNDHIGPVQFNMGGIQVDAEDMLKRLKDRERAETPDREAPQRPVTPDGGKKQNEVLASFFAGLMKRGAGGDSPRPNN